MKTDRNVLLHQNSKTDKIVLRKKYSNHQLSIVFENYLIKFHEILSNSLNRCSRGCGRLTEDTKTKCNLIFQQWIQKKGN